MLARRVVLLAPVAAILAPMAKAQPATKDSVVKFAFEVPLAHQQLVEEQLKIKGRQEESKEKGGLIAVIVGAVAAIYLADAIFRLVQKVESVGVVIDTRGAKINISTDSRLPRGSVLVTDASGSHLYLASEVSSPDKMAELLLKK